MLTIHALDFYILKDLVTGHSGEHFDRVVSAWRFDDNVAVDCDAYFIFHGLLLYWWPASHPALSSLCDIWLKYHHTQHLKASSCASAAAAGNDAFPHQGSFF
jgi:hypothetical protein